MNQQLTEDGATALMTATQMGHVELTVALLARGALPDLATYDDHTTALMLAASYGYQGVAEALLGGGAGVRVVSR